MKSALLFELAGLNADMAKLLALTAQRARRAERAAELALLGLWDVGARLEQLQKEVKILAITNSNGHTKVTLEPIRPRRLVAATNLTSTAATLLAVWMDSSSSNQIRAMNGTEAACNAFVGILAPGSYLAGATIDVYPPGYIFPTPLSTPYDGELYAGNDGQLFPTIAAAVSINQWSLKVAKSTANDVQVLEGQVEQREE